MGILGWIKRQLRVKSLENQSINQSYDSKQALETVSYSDLGTPQPSQSSIQLEKESLQLGVAAGYTGRFIRDIESALNRIESQMVTKDWLIIKLEEAMKEHETKEESRFQSIEALLSSLLRYLDNLPENTRLETIRETVNEMRLTNKMQHLINIVEESKELSYRDLAVKLHISQDALRGLLSRVVRRTNKIQRFERDNKGWVRFISELNQKINQKSADNTVQEGISDQ